MFQKRFEPAITRKLDPKRQTIRPTPRGRMPQAGDFESWRYWKDSPYRSKQIEMVQVELTEVLPIKLESLAHEDIVVIAGKLLPLEQFHDFAVADGFKNFPEMSMWFFGKYGESFTGILIRAKDAPTPKTGMSAITRNTYD